jgi:hypothetical protein
MKKPTLTVFRTNDLFLFNTAVHYPAERYGDAFRFAIALQFLVTVTQSDPAKVRR